jgi:hypothetical protein
MEEKKFISAGTHSERFGSIFDFIFDDFVQGFHETFDRNTTACLPGIIMFSERMDFILGEGSFVLAKQILEFFRVNSTDSKRKSSEEAFCVSHRICLLLIGCMKASKGLKGKKILPIIPVLAFIVVEGKSLGCVCVHECGLPAIVIGIYSLEFLLDILQHIHVKYTESFRHTIG